MYRYTFSFNINHYRRAALGKWKQYKGSDATYKNLIVAFELAGHKDFADTVRTLAGKLIIMHDFPPD